MSGKGIILRKTQISYEHRNLVINKMLINSHSCTSNMQKVKDKNITMFKGSTLHLEVILLNTNHYLASTIINFDLSIVQ